MDMVELWSGDSKAVIDPLGAWVVNLSDDAGDVLYPKRRLMTPEGVSKERGGSHVCLPNFGPGGESGLPQHGFGRALSWTVEEQTENHVALRLAKGTSGYESLVSQVVYTLGDASLTMTLTIENTATKPLQVAPAFHPYFALSQSEDTVRINGKSVAVADFAEMISVEGRSTMELTTAKRTLRLQAEHLAVWAQWSDQLGAYMCVEPTARGYAFLETDDHDMVSAGETRQYSMTIAW